MTESARPRPQEPQAFVLRYRLQLGLFATTALSVFWTGAQYGVSDPRALDTGWLAHLWSGWPFALPLLTILLFHEFGHWFAARYHRVPASLPYFIPLPLVGLFGTLGAVIAMPDRIRSRNALMDIGAAGPLAGLLVAIPVLMIGLSLSEVAPPPEHYIQEGQSLLYVLLKRLVVGPIPEGHDVTLHPTAMAGWTGLFLTMVNLMPWGQLDGGHIAFALFGAKQHRFARVVRWLLLAMFLFNLCWFVLPIQLGTSTMPFSLALSNSSPWLVWYVITGVLGRAFGAEHPPFEAGELTRGRVITGVLCALLFFALLTPTPLAFY